MNVTMLRGKVEKELREDLLASQREQSHPRMQTRLNPAAVRSDQIVIVRRNIARVKTIMNESRGGVES